MKNFPNGRCMPALDEYDIDMNFADQNEYQRKLTSLKLRQMTMSEDEQVSPDTYRCDCLFLMYFLTMEMEDEFALIAKDFLQHEYIHLEEYYDLRYVNDFPEASWPERSFQFMILNMMMGAVKRGNEYARSLFCYLHKTYYKKEYKLLKRFHTMSGTEVISIAEDPERGVGMGDMARVLCMASMYGIKLGVDCNFLYLYLDDVHKEYVEEDEVEFISFSEELFDKSKEILEELFCDSSEMMKESDRVDRYMGKALGYFGFPEDYIYICDDGDFGDEKTFQKTIALMRMAYPNKQFDKHEVALHAGILRAIGAVSSICCRQYEVSKEVFGIANRDFFESFPPLFQPEAINPPRTKQNKQVAKPEVVEKIENDDKPLYKEEALLKEIDRLRGKLHCQEEDNKHLMNLVRVGKKKLEEQEQLRSRQEQDLQELAALREHVYNFTQFDQENQHNNLDKMDAAIAAHKIVIIGGHDNWVKKMKQKFPTWTFISPNASGTVDKRLLQKAERVYFFTESIAHSTYYKFIQIVREQGISFGYIHGVNIDSNVAQIYQDFT